MAAALLAAADPDPGFRLAAPLLTVHGDRDSNGAPLAAAVAALMARHPQARLAVIPGAGRCAHQDEPDRFAVAVEPFLREVLGGAEP